MLEAYLPGILISTDVLWDIEGRVDTIFLELEVMVVVFQQLPNLSLIKFF